MKQITDILMSKQFLIGLGVGIAGVYAYNRYMTKEVTSNAVGGRKRGKGCTCADGTTGYCISTCDNCCRGLGGAKK